MAVEDIGARRPAEFDAPDRYPDRLKLASSAAAVSANKYASRRRPPKNGARKNAKPTILL